MADIVTFQEALEHVLTAAGSFAAEHRLHTAHPVPLLAANGRVLAETVVADRDQPPFDRSTRDGFAVRAADLNQPLKLLGSVRAGERWTGAPLLPGETIEIMTGTPLASGADAVLMLEHIEHLADGRIAIAAGHSLAPGANVVPRGAEALAGTPLIPAGRRLAAAEIALAAQCGCAQVSVWPKPRVAILATGDELVELTATPAPWQIRNSNTAALAALVAETGGEPLPLAIARDDMDDLRARLAEARAADLLLLSGGLSAGKYDLVEAALAEAGAQFHFTGALIQPGRPVVFGELPARDPDRPTLPFFGLPGNPISTEVCFRLFAAPLLRALAGEPVRGPRFAEARLAETVRGGAAVVRFLPATIQGDWQQVSVRLVPWQGSGDLAANARANGFTVLPIGPTSFPAGETVRVLLR